jgi:hypothetical protein
MTKEAVRRAGDSVKSERNSILLTTRNFGQSLFSRTGFGNGDDKTPTSEIEIKCGSSSTFMVSLLSVYGTLPKIRTWICYEISIVWIRGLAKGG